MNFGKNNKGRNMKINEIIIRKVEAEYKKKKINNMSKKSKMPV